MSVYPKKNARGDPTGLWVTEVTIDGKRTRTTSRDRVEALAAETALLGRKSATSPPAAVPAAPRAYTVGDLAREAVTLWRDDKDRETSERRFLAVCELLKPETPLAAVRTAQLDDVVTALRGRSLGNKTIHRYLAAFSGPLRWATARDHIAGMPIIPWPKTGKGNDTVIELAEEKCVLARLYKVGSPDVALVVDVLLATGCRVGELLKLLPEDILPEREQLVFRDTKNDDDRYAYLEHALCVKLKALAVVGFPT